MVDQTPSFNEGLLVAMMAVLEEKLCGNEGLAS
jgi:hypothetical protein